MGYRKESAWNDINEIKCLLICKKLMAENFPWGEQKRYSLMLEKDTDLTWGSISAKISNYKSLFGINNESHVSQVSIAIYNKYKDFSIIELEKILR